MESWPIYVPSIDCSSRQSKYQLKCIMSNTTHNISLATNGSTVQLLATNNMLELLATDRSLQ